MEPIRKNALRSPFALLFGFGGLLALLALTGYGGLASLRQIQNSDSAFRDQFLVRTRVLERLRADLYISGTYARDYLLEPEAGRAEGHRDSLLEAHRDMDSALKQYQGLLNPQETAPFQALTASLESYWQTLDPVLRWTPAQRQKNGYAFLRDWLFPRRMAMLGIADQIGAINEAQLNQGKNEVEATFARLRGRLALAAALTIGLGFALAGFSVARILTLERAAAERYAEVAHARRQLQALSARLAQAHEDDRKAIARELHDEIGQALTAVRVELANLSNLMRVGDAQGAREKAEEARKLIENSIGVVRNLALLLRPSMLDDLGLVPALQWQAREVSKRSQMRVHVAAEGVSNQLPDEYKTAIYRIVQEALNNAVKHAHAQNVTVTVQRADGRLLLAIADDGQGFDPRRERGMGLVGIAERVSHLGGAFGIDSAQSHGTVLRITFPLEEAAAPDGEKSA